MADLYPFGIEEEYFLIDAETRAVSRSMPKGFLDEAKAALRGAVASEFLQSQIEVMTQPLTSMSEARDTLAHLRGTLGEVASRYGLGILAAGTHPTGNWERSRQTEGERYDAVMDDLRMIGQRNMLCGLHVHVQLADEDARIDVMTRMLPFLPLFVALSTSSPFWRSRTTGLKGYRLAAYDELPRTGLPELFKSKAEFDAYIDALVQAEVIPDSSYIWWAIRPSLKYPTLELRAPDCCTRIEDAIAIAALYRSLVRRLHRNPGQNAHIDAVARAIAVENKWRAQRYGVNGTFVRFAGDGAIPVGDMLEAVLTEIAEDADALGCRREVENCRAILERGTSADRQIALFRQFADNPEHGFARVLEWLAETTLAGTRDAVEMAEASL